jgi:Glutaredoxin-like domain (DUF836)
MESVPPRVLMYSRRRCGLCDEARSVIEAVGRTIPLDLDEVFIDGNDALERRYGLRVPVVEVGGEEAFEFTVDAEDLTTRLRAAG